ncbi:hypothetical protein HN51_024540, partial [Arachis hypogaea]
MVGVRQTLFSLNAGLLVRSRSDFISDLSGTFMPLLEQIPGLGFSNAIAFHASKA